MPLKVPEPRFQESSSEQELGEWCPKQQAVGPIGGAHGRDNVDLGLLGQFSLHVIGLIELAFGIDLVEKALSHGWHDFPPDGEHEDDAVGGEQALLVVSDLRVDGLAAAPIAQVTRRHHGIKAVRVQVDQVDVVVFVAQLGHDALEQGR